MQMKWLSFSHCEERAKQFKFKLKSSLCGHRTKCGKRTTKNALKPNSFCCFCFSSLTEHIKCAM